MSEQFPREVPQDQPQNIPPNALTTHPNPNPNPNPKTLPSSNLSQLGSAQSAQARSIFQTTILQTQKILKKIDEFNQITNKVQKDWSQLQELFNNHIRANIHPCSCSNVGDFLLRNGKFIVVFIQVITRNQKKDLLKNYLYNYFEELNKISHDKEVFDKNRQIILQRAQQNKTKNKYPQVAEGRNRLLISPDSSRNQGNWSTKVEKDTNSPYRSSVLDSQYQKKSLEGLKRLDIDPPKEINQQQQRSQKIRNTKKSVKKSTTKTKPKITPNKTKSKTKSSQRKISAKSQPRELKILKQTGIHIKQQNENQQQQKLGSCYHYQLSVNPKNKHPQLTQVRASARLSNKHDRTSITRQNLRKSTNSKSKRKSRSKSKSKNKNKKQQNGKKTRKRNAQTQSNITEDDSSSYHPDDEEVSIDVEWVKDHLKQLDIHDVKMYSQFVALTSKDIKITKLIQSMQSSQEATETMPVNLDKKTKKRTSHPSSKKPQLQPQHQTQPQQPQQHPQEPQQQIPPPPPSPKQQPKTFSQLKKQYSIEQLPLTIDYVINPDLNNHGIYAMLRLGRVTQLQMGTPYALSPITCGLRANKKHIKQDLQTAKELAGQYGLNIAYLPMNLKIMEMITAARNQPLINN